MSTYLDIDNPVKVILDSVSDKLDVDDKHCHELFVKKCPIKRNEPGYLDVSLREITMSEQQIYSTEYQCESCERLWILKSGKIINVNDLKCPVCEGSVKQDESKVE